MMISLWLKHSECVGLVFIFFVGFLCPFFPLNGSSPNLPNQCLVPSGSQVYLLGPPEHS